MSEDEKTKKAKADIPDDANANAVVNAAKSNEQLERAERNRLAALAKLQQRKQMGLNTALPSSPSPSPSPSSPSTIKTTPSKLGQQSGPIMATLPPPMRVPITDHLTEESWKRVLSKEFTQPYWQQLMSFLESERQAHSIYPPEPLIFNAFNVCPYDKVKVVIIGQDPYHGKGQAMGLCFGVNYGVQVPPSLQNTLTSKIYKELKSEYPDFVIPNHGNLEEWGRQGVLLLNTSLTVRAACPSSHAGKGWEQFTDAAIRALAKKPSKVVFILWGKHAQAKSNLVDKSKHAVLTAAHPSPYSADKGFFGCGHFVAANQVLSAAGEEPIRWQLPVNQPQNSSSKKRTSTSS